MARNYVVRWILGRYMAVQADASTADQGMTESKAQTMARRYNRKATHLSTPTYRTSW